jgi:hypothetical protein
MYIPLIMYVDLGAKLLVPNLAGVVMAMVAAVSELTPF